MLLFKKLRLFAILIKALKVVYKTKEYVYILKDRAIKIFKWSISLDLFEVRNFLDIIDITYR